MAVVNPTLDQEDIEIMEGIQGREAPISEEEQTLVLKQISREHKTGLDYNSEKRAEWHKRLKLYNNQRRDPDKVGDNTLYVVFQTVLASLYTDVLSVLWAAVERGDEEVAENLNVLSEHDHRVMEMDELGYEWLWDAAFFGRGLIELNDFDVKTKTPVAEVWDPLVTLRDPLATSVNGNQKGYGAARFLGREVSITLYQMEDHPKFFNLDKLIDSKNAKIQAVGGEADHTQDMTDEAQRARREAQNLEHTIDKRANILTNNIEFELIQWFTHRSGKKYIATCSKDFKTLVRWQELEQQDRWPIIDRSIYPMAHDWDGVSIPDLIEDKQRARATMLNLGLESAHADLYPQYLYNAKKITNKKDLDFAFNKFIPVNGDVNNAVLPVQKSLFHNQVKVIMDVLDLAAQKAVAAPEIAQGVQPEESRTLGEVELVAASRGVRSSLAAKVLGWSEKRLWRQWYTVYKLRFKKALGTKSVRLSGPMGPVWRELGRENIIANIDPDVFVQSKATAEQERRQEFQEFMAFLNIALQDPTNNRRFGMRQAARILQRTRKEIDFMIPPNVDEMQAEDENIRINRGEFVPVDALDDDMAHLVIHDRAKEGKAKTAHILAHKELMKAKKKNPGMVPMPQNDFQFTPVAQGGGANQAQQKRGPQQPTSRGQEEPVASRA